MGGEAGGGLPEVGGGAGLGVPAPGTSPPGTPHHPAASSCWRRSKKVFNHLALFAALTFYTVIGGIIFKELEYPNEVSTLEQLESQVLQDRKHFLSVVCSQVNCSQSVRGHYDARTLVEIELGNYEKKMQEAAKRGVLVPLSESTPPQELAKWNYVQSVFFASTVITTIGYGNLAPVTVGGRWFCIVFAVVGIPLALTVIADVGMLLAASLPCVLSGEGVAGAVGGPRGGAFSRLFDSWPALKSLFTALGALLLLLVFLSVGALLFRFLEDGWNFLDSFYFCFITMTTIGFGDLVPEKPQYMLLCTAYILIGLSLTSTIIELVRLEYLKSWRRLQAVAEALRRLAEAGAQGHDIQALQADLKNMLSAIATSKDQTDSWHRAISNIVDDIGVPKPKQEPVIVQVIVYETSV